MNRHILGDQTTARREISAMFLRASAPDGQEPHAILEVREDKCFNCASTWLGLGDITLKPGGPDRLGESREAVYSRAVQFGAYEWSTPTLDAVERGLLDACGFQAVDALVGQAEKEKEKEKRDPQKRRARKCLEGLVHVLQRVGLQHPVFDAAAVSLMPFRRPTTVVADTNAVLQGALDFVQRFLSPMARLRIPAVVQMEILVWVNNYFDLRRDTKKLQRAIGTALQEHMRGQGAQRALLRLELLTDAEVERSRIGSDPLRGIVQHDSDQEHVNLGLQVVQKSFADRLILETAIQHQHQVQHGHTLLLLTSDQGLARMALAEGVQVLFYEAADLATITNSIIPGTLFHPFEGSLYSIPLPELVWELAVTFGECRLRFPETGDQIEVAALGESRRWHPYHSKEDLLWLLPTRSTSQAGGASEVSSASDPEQFEAELLTVSGDDIEETEVVATGAGSKILQPSYKFSTKVMLRLIQLLAGGKEYRNEELMRQLGFTHERKLAEYRGFLNSGGFISYSKPTITKTEKLDAFWLAVRNKQHKAVGELLLTVHSVRVFYDAILAAHPLPRDAALPIKSDAVPNYRCLLELSGLALQIPGDGIYATPAQPTAGEFAKIGFDTYLRLARREDAYIATGAWLEELAKSEGIHPIETRQRLDEARVAGLVERYVEGSTPDTRFANRTFCMIDLLNNELTVREVALYEGDFLIPGKGSVSLRLKREAK